MLSPQQETIINSLKNANASDESAALPLQELIDRCGQDGLTDIKQLETALVQLIDSDLVDYEMNENGEPNSFWVM